MAGPLTPPPTEADLQAQQQAPASVPIQIDDTPQVAPASDASQTSAAPTHDSNTVAFTTIAQLASSQEYNGLIEYAERAEISTDAPRAVSRLFVVSPLIIAYLIVDDLPLAYTVLNRLPPGILSHPLCQAIAALFVALHKQEYRKVYERVNSVTQLVSQPDFLDPHLATVLTNMINILLEAFRSRMFKLLSKAYHSIPVTVAEVYLGSLASQIVEVAQKSGWTLDNASQILYPSTTPTSVLQVSSAPSTLSSFHIVADAVGKLEL